MTALEPAAAAANGAAATRAATGPAAARAVLAARIGSFSFHGERTPALRGGVLSRLAAVRLQMVPLVLGLIEDSGSRAQALDARGFGAPGPRTSYREVADPPAQRRLRTALLLLTAAAVTLRLVASWPGAGPV